VRGVRGRVRRALAGKRELYSEGEDPVRDLLDIIPDPDLIPADAGYEPEPAWPGAPPRPRRGARAAPLTVRPGCRGAASPCVCAPCVALSAPPRLGQLSTA
jgi:hypothetical protein